MMTHNQQNSGHLQHHAGLFCDRMSSGFKRSHLLRAYRSLVIILAVLGVTLCGCGSGHVGNRSGSKYKYWYTLTRPIVSDQLEFEDDRIFIQFRIDESFINFRLQNFSSRTLSLLWDRVTLAVDGKIAPIKYSANGYDRQPARWTPTATPPDGWVFEATMPFHRVF